ncbi:MAG: segregation/condensation protein A [Alphaproteobacteria bacterium]|nr:segregation/condensation protein A [Alphaproteobacteria bacterium]MBV8549115.1 segregation/condensation protein A [Alphaproteobacteria bacterium]
MTEPATELPLTEGASASDLVLALQGFEGPIDLLLNLAREQKLDLGTISILQLAEQYLAYIASARKLRLEIAADYLVMAAWLAFLKSRLLLPQQEATPEGEPDPAALAEALKFQLMRLEAMQKAALQVQERPQLGTDIFLRGQPEKMEIEEKPIYFLPIQDLLLALAAPMRRRKPPAYKVIETRLYSMEESVVRLRGLLGNIPNWGTLKEYLPEVVDKAQALEVRSALASTFAATLELVKNGELELRQDGTYAPIYIRRREASAMQAILSEETISE